MIPVYDPFDKERSSPLPPRAYQSGSLTLSPHASLEISTDLLASLLDDKIARSVCRADTDPVITDFRVLGAIPLRSDQKLDPEFRDQLPVVPGAQTPPSLTVFRTGGDSFQQYGAGTARTFLVVDFQARVVDRQVLFTLKGSEQVAPFVVGRPIAWLLFELTAGTKVERFPFRWPAGSGVPQPPSYVDWLIFDRTKDHVSSGIGHPFDPGWIGSYLLVGPDLATARQFRIESLQGPLPGGARFSRATVAPRPDFDAVFQKFWIAPEIVRHSSDAVLTANFLDVYSHPDVSQLEKNLLTRLKKALADAGLERISLDVPLGGVLPLGDDGIVNAAVTTGFWDVAADAEMRQLLAPPDGGDPVRAAGPGYVKLYADILTPDYFDPATLALRYNGYQRLLDMPESALLPKRGTSFSPAAPAAICLSRELFRDVLRPEFDGRPVIEMLPAGVKISGSISKTIAEITSNYLSASIVDAATKITTNVALSIELSVSPGGLKVHACADADLDAFSLFKLVFAGSIAGAGLSPVAPVVGPASGLILGIVGYGLGGREATLKAREELKQLFEGATETGDCVDLTNKFKYALLGSTFTASAVAARQTLGWLDLFVSRDPPSLPPPALLGEISRGRWLYPVEQCVGPVRDPHIQLTLENTGASSLQVCGLYLDEMHGPVRREGGEPGAIGVLDRFAANAGPLPLPLDLAPGARRPFTIRVNIEQQLALKAAAATQGRPAGGYYDPGLAQPLWLIVHTNAGIKMIDLNRGETTVRRLPSDVRTGGLVVDIGLPGHGGAVDPAKPIDPATHSALSLLAEILCGIEPNQYRGIMFRAETFTDPVPAAFGLGILERVLGRSR